MNKTNGKIANRSKEMIVDAMLTIMKQYDYREITITQIAQEADLSRKTFYRLFRDKEEVLMHLFESLYQECIGQLKKREVQHYWDVVQCYFDFWEERRDILMLMKQNHLLLTLFEGAYNYSFQVFEYVRSREIVNKLDTQLPYLLAYSVGGMHSMLMKWVEDDMTIPSSVLIEQLKDGFKSEEL